MATTTYGVGDSLTAKQWARKLEVEALKATEIAPLIGTDSNSCIHLKKEFSKGGDRVTFGLRMQLTGDGVSEGQVLEGNEESLTTYSDNILINELRHAAKTRQKGTIDDQRVLFNARTEAKDALRDWFAKRMSIGFFGHACGMVATGTNTFTSTGTGLTVDYSKAVYNLMNTTLAPTSGRHIWANGAAADETLTTSDYKFDLRLIDYAKEAAMTAFPKIRPMNVNGKQKYVCYLHPYQVTDMRINTTTGQWLDITKAADTGRNSKDNKIYSGALGEYNDVIFRVSDDVPPGLNSSTSAVVANTRRAVLLGAQACAMGYGQDRSEASPYKWVEEEFDYKHDLGVSISTVLGMKKCQFNSKDFGTVVIATYAAAH